MLWPTRSVPVYAGWRRGLWPRARPGWAGVDPVQALHVQCHTPVHAPVSCPGDRAARPACGPCDAPVPRNPAPAAARARRSRAPIRSFGRRRTESELFIHSLRSSSAIRSSCRRTGPELRPAPPAAPRPRHLGLYHRTQPRQQLMLLRDQTDRSGSSGTSRNLAQPELEVQPPYKPGAPPRTDRSKPGLPVMET